MSKPRQDGRRRMTVLLPTRELELVRAACFVRETTPSTVVAEAIAAHLGQTDHRTTERTDP